jgi:hypothetical protein
MASAVDRIFVSIDPMLSTMINYAATKDYAFADVFQALLDSEQAIVVHRSWTIHPSDQLLDAYYLARGV